MEVNTPQIIEVVISPAVNQVIEVNPPILTTVEIISNPIPINGKDAYEVAQSEGFIGTRQEWLESLNANLIWSSTDW